MTRTKTPVRQRRELICPGAPSRERISRLIEISFSRDMTDDEINRIIYSDENNIGYYKFSDRIYTIRTYMNGDQFINWTMGINVNITYSQVLGMM